MDQPTDYISVTDAAKILGIARESVSRRMTRGELPFTPLGDRRLLRRADVIAARDRERAAGGRIYKPKPRPAPPAAEAPTPEPRPLSESITGLPDEDD